MRYNWMRRGRMTRMDILVRRMRRAWNEWDGVGLADWIMGYGVLALIGIAAILILAAWIKMGG